MVDGDPEPKPAQLERKRKSIERVRALELPVLEHLPVIEDESEVAPRTTREVAERCLATLICAVRGETDDPDFVARVIATWNAASWFSPEEKAFLDKADTTQRDRAKFTWRYECVHVFLWALGHVLELQAPDEIAPVGKEANIVRVLGPEHFVARAQLRSQSELLDQADLYYRLHWATRELRLAGKEAPNADDEIVLERHRALNWLIRYMDQAWDDVTTDT